jgi:hypothetical protein
MIKQIENPLVDFQSAKPNYLLLGFSAVVLVCLCAGFVMSFAAKNWILSTIFFVSAAGIAVFSWLNLREAKKASAGEQVKKLRWEIALPDNQRHKLISEVREIAQILDVPQENFSDLVSAYVVAEDLALRQIQQEAKTPLMRHVSVFETPFDAVFVKTDLITCVEVSFVAAPVFRQEKIDFILGKISSVQNRLLQKNIESRVRLLLVLVTQLDQSEEARLRSIMKDKFVSTPVDVDIRMLDFESLQKIYAMN